MMFKGNNMFQASFEIFADTYHSVRPGYPDVLFMDIRKLAKVGDRPRMLEIGAGSGIATVKLAEFGGRLIAIEPGKHLAEIARKASVHHAHVKVLEGTFEDFVPDGEFDVVLAFTAFHWLKDGDKYQKVADLLTEEGSLVLVWNSFLQSEDEVTEEVNALYAELLPDIYPEASDPQKVNTGVTNKLASRIEEVAKNPIFGLAEEKQYLCTYTYDGITYPKLLNTFPKIIEIDEGRRKEFLKRVGEIVVKHQRISVPVLTTLVVAKKRTYLQMVAGED